MTTRHPYTRTLMIGLVAAFAALALLTTANAGGKKTTDPDSGGEPGAGCLAVTGNSFEALRGTLFAGEGTVTFDTGTQVTTFGGTVTQFVPMGSTCTLTITSAVVPPALVPDKAAFDALHPGDLVGFCIQNIVDQDPDECAGGTEVAEILSAGQLRRDTNISFAVDVRVIPVKKVQ